MRDRNNRKFCNLPKEALLEIATFAPNHKVFRVDKSARSKAENIFLSFFGKESQEIQGFLRVNDLFLRFLELNQEQRASALEALGDQKVRRSLMAHIHIPERLNRYIILLGHKHFSRVVGTNVSLDHLTRSDERFERVILILNNENARGAILDAGMNISSITEDDYNFLPFATQHGIQLSGYLSARQNSIKSVPANSQSADDSTGYLQDICSNRLRGDVICELVSGSIF